MIKKIFLPLSLLCCSSFFSSQSPANNHCLICPKESRESLKASFQQSIENVQNVPHETLMKIFDHVEKLEASFLALFPNKDLQLYDAVKEYYTGINYNEEGNLVFPLAEPVKDKIIDILSNFIEEHKFHEEQLGSFYDLLRESFTLMVKINFLASLGQLSVFPQSSSLKIINTFGFSLLIFNLTIFHWVYNQDFYKIISIPQKTEFIEKCQEKIL